MPLKDREKNKEYHKNYHKEYYLKNKVSYMERSKINNPIHREKMRAFIRDIKLEKGCVRCGYKEHPAALDFHHKDGKKDMQISRMVYHGIDKIKKEIDKCEILCANCHRIEHSIWVGEGN